MKHPLAEGKIMSIYWGAPSTTRLTKNSIQASMNDIHYQLQALDVALTALARHEREVTGDTVTADNATKNIINIVDTLFEDGHI